MLFNDLHSKLNPCTVLRVEYPQTKDEIITIIKLARSRSERISIGGQLHSMGGQPYAESTLNISTKKLNRILSLNTEVGYVDVESGVIWSQLIPDLIEQQKHNSVSWGIIQKQTGADDLSIGGALSSNIHGRGLQQRPFVDDVLGFELVTPTAEVLWCSPESNAELFSLVAGGYGLFGFVTYVRLKLQKRHVVERHVEITPINTLAEKFTQRRSSGYEYGDYQFLTDETDPDYMRSGVFSCYRPCAQGSTVSSSEVLNENDWDNLLLLAHLDKAQVWKRYSDFYLATHKQRYWSDTHQLSVYVPDYHDRLGLSKKRGLNSPSSEMIMEYYVPADKLTAQMDAMREYFLDQKVNLIYGTIRFIKEDQTSFLRWAKQDMFCIVINLNVIHTPEAIQKSKNDFMRIIDLAIGHGGGFYLTYNTWINRQQIVSYYPQMKDFLAKKLIHDPEEMLVSNWYLYYKEMLRES